MKTATGRIFSAVRYALVFVPLAIPGPHGFADATPAKDDRPNVLFIVTDDQEQGKFDFLPEGRDELGKPKNLSLTIDRLAAEGVVFLDQYVTSPVCTPSCYSVLTGTHAGRSPSFAEAPGIKYPDEIGDRSLHPMDGVSLLPLIRGEALAARNLCFAYEDYRVVGNDKWKRQGLLSTQKNKPGVWHLFDLTHDQGETVDVADDHAEAVARLAGVWNAWDEDVGVTSGYREDRSRKAEKSLEDEDFQLVKTRYRQWLLDGATTDDSHEFVRRQYEAAVDRARRAQQAAREIDFGGRPALYDTRKSGPDRREVYLLVTQVLPDLSTAYHLRGGPSGDNPFHHDDRTLDLVLRVFDRLHDRGFRPDMQMPWKARDGKETDPPTAIIADFHLRTAGYALAAFLMRDELQAAGKLDRTLKTCEAVCRHGEKTGDLAKLKLNADGVRIAVNFILPYALAANDADRLTLLKRQIDRSMAVESDASDTIKPDGLGFHHLGVYLAGYAPYAVSQAAQMAWLLRDTEYRLEAATVDNLRRSLLILRIVSQKYDMHKALAGRLRSIAVIPDVLLGYAYLAALEDGGDRRMSRALARLCDGAFLNSGEAMRPFAGHRDEATPGPAAVAFFFRTLASASQLGPEPEPEGHWALNYGPLSVHRRDDWMVSVKGFSKCLWAFERSLTDDLDEERRQNVLGFHDSSCTIRIHGRGNPIGADASGYDADGWDWCRLPGTTVRLIPPERLLQMDHQGGRFNRPFGHSGFAGGVSLGGRHGLFAMDYSEVSCDSREKPLQANQSVFFFDDQIVVLASDIRNGDGVFPVGTTLYQCRLAEPQTPAWEQGRQIVAEEREERYTGGKPLTLVDPVGNGYYIPRAHNVVVRRGSQESLDYTATRKTVGNFATAWFDHGPDPEHARCQYVILIRSDAERLAEFAARAADDYQVLQQDATAHVVRHHRLGLTGYALFRADVPLRWGVIAETDTPCLVLTANEPGPVISFSVCNPDLGWESGRQYAFRPKDRPDTEQLALPPQTPVGLTLRGAWQVDGAQEEARVELQNGFTRVQVECSDARSIEFRLRLAAGT